MDIEGSGDVGAVSYQRPPNPKHVLPSNRRLEEGKILDAKCPNFGTQGVVFENFSMIQCVIYTTC